MLCSVPDRMKTWQDSAFLLLAGRGSIERGGGGKGLLKNILVFPAKLDYLGVQMSLTGNLKRGNAFLVASDA